MTATAMGAGGVAVVGAAAAALAAYTEGALLAVPEGAEVPGDVADVVGRRVEVQRALTLLRRLLQVATGAGSAAVLALDARPWWQAALMALVSGLVIVGLSESVARAAGDARGLEALRPSAAMVRAAEAVFAPVAGLGLALDRWLGRTLPAPVADAADREEAVEQFSEVLAAEAEVAAPEEQVIHRVLSLGDTGARDVMVPRVDIVGVALDTPWSEVVDRVRSSEHSRVVVWRRTVDDVAGVLFAKDLLPWVVDDEEPPGGWATLMRPVAFFPPSKPVDDLLREFRATGTHIAIIADEYGGTAGLVTIEDILEELVGDIRDETDAPALELEPGEGGTFWADGRTSLARLAEATGRPFEREDVATVGGLVLAQLGRVPRAGERLEVEGYRLVVERVRRRGVARVYLEPAPVPVAPAQ